MELRKLGWNADLNRHFGPYHAKGLIPARVVVEDRLLFRIWTADVELLVETPMASGGSGADGSFNRLFRFITGGNEAKQKIAVTTPVFMSGSGTNKTIAFVMPAKPKGGKGRNRGGTTIILIPKTVPTPGRVRGSRLKWKRKPRSWRWPDSNGG